jgi:hypothetical protein
MSDADARPRHADVCSPPLLSPFQESPLPKDKDPEFQIGRWGAALHVVYYPLWTSLSSCSCMYGQK